MIIASTKLIVGFDHVNKDEVMRYIATVLSSVFILFMNTMFINSFGWKNRNDLRPIPGVIMPDLAGLGLLGSIFYIYN